MNALSAIGFSGEQEMIHRQIRFHNVAELPDAPGLPGVMLSRYPAAVRHRMGARGRFVGMESTGCELRFVTDAPNVQLTLSCLRPEFAPEADIQVYRGGFPVGRNLYRLDSERAVVVPGKVNTLFLSEVVQLEGFAGSPPTAGGFAPNVWRVAFGRGCGIFCGIDAFGAEVRAPLPEETPRLRYLAYGSSITHASLDGYAMVAARRLGLDVSNAGLSGACAAEPEVADWLAGRGDWEVMTIEVGINIMGIDVEEYRHRVDYLVGAVRRRHPRKPVALITVFPFRGMLEGNPIGQRDQYERFNAIMREMAVKYETALIEGADLLDSPECYSADLVHPSVYGHAVMGLNLAEKLRPLLEKALF